MDAEEYWSRDLFGDLVLGDDAAAQNSSSSLDLNPFILSSNDLCQDSLHFECNEKPFREFDDIEEVQSQDGMQNLIDEMEDFLNKHESPSPPNNVNEDVKLSPHLLEALMKGNVVQSPGVQPVSKESAVINASNITNVSEFVLEDGRNIIIMIAASSPASSVSDVGSLPGGVSSSNPCSPIMPSSLSSPQHESNDEDWTPSQPLSTRKRTNRNRPSLSSNMKATCITDKKERKKWQNVEAARRYRDKKKVENTESEIEGKMLEDKNIMLKEKIREMENEVTTLKKLMKELGFIKVL